MLVFSVKRQLAVRAHGIAAESTDKTALHSQTAMGSLESDSGGLLSQAGSEFVRITVNTPEAAAAVPYIREQLDRMGESVPLVGDFITTGIGS